MAEIITFQNQQVTVMRSPKRKTIAIQIKAAQVFILVPQALAKAEIERVLLKKHRWMTEKLALQTQHQAIAPKEFVKGEMFGYLGHDYPLEIVEGSTPRIHLYQNQLLAVVRNMHSDNSASLKKLFMRWYQQQAERVLGEKTRHYANIIGVVPASIVVKTFKARWGSCSTKHDIQYNWKLIMATEAVVDYVVVHELCHILHPNHSPAFWQTVAFYYPQYQTCRAWLKLHGKRLEI